MNESVPFYIAALDYRMTYDAWRFDPEIRPLYNNIRLRAGYHLGLPAVRVVRAVRCHIDLILPISLTMPDQGARNHLHVSKGRAVKKSTKRMAVQSYMCSDCIPSWQESSFKQKRCRTIRHDSLRNKGYSMKISLHLMSLNG
jgi:hypothetical protein